MEHKLKNYFTDRLVSVVKSLSSQEFPLLAKIILEHKFDTQMELRGQTVTGEPIGHTLDANSPGFADVAEFGKGADYFKDKHITKILDDYRHCLRLAPHCRRIFLLSSRVCGPKRYTQLSRVAAWLGSRINKSIYVLDGQWIATYIIDEILTRQDTPTLEKLQNHLAVFRQLSIEFSYSHEFPQLPKENLLRPVQVNDVLTKLDTHKYVHIHGMSGMGKTYLAVQVAKELKLADPERMVIWIPGKTLANSGSLTHLIIERYGVPQNILGLIERFKCIIVIDSLENGVEDVVATITRQSVQSYRLIITSQTAADVDATYDIPALDDDLSSKILNADLLTWCPPTVYPQIQTTIGGHPFLLDQINILVKKERISWNKVVREIENITASTFDNQAFYDRLFKEHLKTASYELGVLKWIDAKELDESLLLELIGKTGIRKLKARNFFNAIRNGSIVLHDIVFNSLRITTIHYDEMQLQAKLDSNLKNLHDDFDPSFYRIIHAHKALIVLLLSRLKKHDIFNYSYLISVSLHDYDARLVPVTDEPMLSEAFRNFMKDDYFLIMSWIEQTEKEYRLLKEDEGYGPTKPFLMPRIALIQKLLAAPNRLSPEVRLDVRNHMGKFLRNIDQKASAIKVFEEIVAEQNDFWAAKFHLAKLYRKDRSSLAQQYLSEIVNAYHSDSHVSSTIVLAAFKEFRSHPILDHTLPKFIDAFGQLIEQTMVSRFDQPYEVLGALASRIQFNMPEKMIELANVLPIPAEDAIENKTLFDVGMIYLNTGKAYDQLKQSDKAIEYYHQAMVYYTKLKGADNFQRRGIAEAYLLLGDATAALARLNEIAEEGKEVWFHFTFAKTLKMLGRPTEALEEINLAITAITQDKQISTFYRERGAIRYILRDTEYLKDYKHALKHCDDPKFTDIINNELAGYGK